MSNQRQQGFTLIELLMVMVALGVVMSLMGGVTKEVGQLRAIAAEERETYRNLLVGQSLMTASSNGDGTLPDTAAGNVMPLLSLPAANADRERFVDALWANGLSVALAQHDGTRAENPRRYRQVEESTEVPLFGNSGDQVTVMIDYAAVYTPIDGVDDDFHPNELEEEDAREMNAYIFSNRTFQEAKLAATRGRLLRIRQAVNNHLTMRRLQAPPNELLTQNFLPGGTPGGGAQQNCGHPWARLSVNSALSEIGLDSTEFEETSWGAPIFYCRNLGANTGAPYFGALAIAKDVNDSATTLPTEHITITL